MLLIRYLTRKGNIVFIETEETEGNIDYLSTM